MAQNLSHMRFLFYLSLYEKGGGWVVLPLMMVPVLFSAILS